MNVDLSQLAALPDIVRALQERVAQLEAKLRPAETESLVGVDRAAQLLGMTPTALRSAAYRGSIPCVKVGRRLRFVPSRLVRACSET